MLAVVMLAVVVLAVVMVAVGIVTVPVNVGDARSALVALAVAMLLNSVVNSEPLITLAALPEGSESFSAKFVVTV